MPSAAPQVSPDCLYDEEPQEYSGLTAAFVAHDPWRDVQYRAYREKDGFRAQRNCCWLLVLLTFMLVWLVNTGQSLYTNPPITVTTEVRQSQTDYPTGNTVNVFVVRVCPVLSFDVGTRTGAANASALYSFHVGNTGGVGGPTRPGEYIYGGAGEKLYYDSCQILVDPFLDALRARRESLAAWTGALLNSQLLFPEQVANMTDYHYWSYDEVPLQPGYAYVVPVCNGLDSVQNDLRLSLVPINGDVDTLRPYTQSPVAYVYSLSDVALLGYQAGAVPLLFQWQYQESTQIDVHLQDTVTRTSALTWFNQTYDYDESLDRLPPREADVQYVYPRPESAAYENGTTSLNLLVNQQYMLVQQTRGSWVFALASSAGGTWTVALAAITAAIFATEFLVNVDWHAGSQRLKSLFRSSNQVTNI